MKGTERYLAFIIERSHITAVEVAHSPKGKTLTAAGSFDSSIDFDNPEVYSEVGAATRERTFVKEMQTFMKEQGMFVPGVYECPEIRAVSPGRMGA